MTKRVDLLVLGGALLLCLSATCLVACDDPTAPEAASAIRIADQYLVNGRITIAKAVADQAGWVVIQHQQSGRSPRFLGAAPLGAGTHNNLKVRFETDVLESIPDVGRAWAVLYQDAGQVGMLEIEGEDAPDQPLLQEGRVVEQPFFLYHTEAIPEAHLFVNDQEMGRGYVLIEEVKMSEPGDVVIHRDKGGTPLVPGIIGKLALEEGIHQNVEVPLFGGEEVACREQLWPMLHVRSTSDNQPYDLDQPIITAPVVKTCEEGAGN